MGLGVGKCFPLKTSGFFIVELLYLCLMNQRDKDILFFIAFCCENYKNKHNLTGGISFSLFEEHKVNQYLAGNYEVLHTQGMSLIMEEIEERINV